MKDGFESLGRIRAQGIALLTVVFIAGGLAGIALERVRVANRVPELPPPGLTGGPPWREGMLPGMFRDLDLTREQRAEIRAILERRRPHSDSVLGQLLPRLRAVTDSVQAEIRAVLTAEQAAKLDSLQAEIGRRRGLRRRPGMRGPGQGPGGPPRRLY